MARDSGTCIRRTSHLHASWSAQEVQICSEKFHHMSGRQMAVLLPHGYEHEQGVFASAGTPCHTHHRNVVCGHAGVRGSPVQIFEQMCFHNLDMHKSAGHHESVNGSPGDPHVRMIPHTPHIRVDAHQNETLHELPDDVFGEMFAHTLDKQRVYPDYELEHG